MKTKRGSLFVVGLGPGDADMILPKVAKVIFRQQILLDTVHMSTELNLGQT